jgi:hypothetical protein
MSKQASTSFRVVTSFHERAPRSFLKLVRLGSEKILADLLLVFTSLLLHSRGTDKKFIK